MSETLTAERLEGLERLARQAAPGEWFANEFYGWFVRAADEDDVPLYIAKVEVCILDDETGERHARFIAAASPATVLALLAERAVLLARIREMEEDE